MPKGWDAARLRSLVHGARHSLSRFSAPQSVRSGFGRVFTHGPRCLRPTALIHDDPKPQDGLARSTRIRGLSIDALICVLSHESMTRTMKARGVRSRDCSASLRDRARGRRSNASKPNAPLALPEALTNPARIVAAAAHRRLAYERSSSKALPGRDGKPDALEPPVTRTR